MNFGGGSGPGSQQGPMMGGGVAPHGMPSPFAQLSESGGGHGLVGQGGVGSGNGGSPYGVPPAFSTQPMMGGWPSPVSESGGGHLLLGQGGGGVPPVATPMPMQPAAMPGLGGQAAAGQDWMGLIHQMLAGPKESRNARMGRN